MGFVIGCDLGSQSLKGVLVSPDGRLVAEASAEYPMAFPKPGFAEQDPNHWLAALAIVTRALLAEAGVKSGDVDVLGLAGQVDGFVPVDGSGASLGPAVIWMDRRATEECRRLAEDVTADLVFQITGLNLDASHVAPKVVWFRDHEPELFELSEWFPAPTSFVVARLTGEHIVDRTNASSTMVYDVHRRQWSTRLLEATGLEPGHFGRIVDSSDVVGTLTREAAADLGLTAHTRVIAGCGDDHGGSLGAGLVRSGMVCDVVGTAEPITATASTPVLDSTRLVETHEHAAGGLWLVENPGFVSGGSVRWCSDLIGVTDPGDFESLAGIAAAGAGGVVFLPGLGGATAPVWDDRARGAFSGLTLSHDRSHVARAVLEGCSFAFRDITDRLVELGIPSDQEVRVVGGGGRSKLWCQIKADVTGRPLRAVATRHATALGAALLAAVAAVQFKSLSEAAGALVELAEVYEPQAELKHLYDDHYARYRQAFAALRPIGWPS